jgi:hypothetical protein
MLKHKSRYCEVQFMTWKSFITVLPRWGRTSLLIHLIQNVLTSLTATGEPPSCMSCVVLFALRNALSAARQDAGKPDEWYPMSKYFMLPYSKPFSTCLSCGPVLDIVWEEWFKITLTHMHACARPHTHTHTHMHTFSWIKINEIMVRVWNCTLILKCQSCCEFWHTKADYLHIFRPTELCINHTFYFYTKGYFAATKFK